MEKLQQELFEARKINQVLIEILDRIDKRILQKHGITITVEKKGRMVN